MLERQVKRIPRIADESLQIVRPDKSPIVVEQSDLSRARLTSMLDHRHPLSSIEQW